MKELIYVAIDNAITHYYTPGMVSHLKHGMNDLGCTKEELMEVFAITSTIGTPTFTVGVPILREALRQRGHGHLRPGSDGAPEGAQGALDSGKRLLELRYGQHPEAGHRYV